MRKILLACMMALGIGTFAQTNVASYSFVKSTGITYTPITGGTKLFPSGTNTTYDNDVSAAIPLSSPFTFGGVAMNSVYVSANGFITFGAAPGGTNYTPLSTLGSTTGAISAFGQDGGFSSTDTVQPSGNHEVRYEDLGTEFVVQWQDHANYYNRSTERLNFQIRLVYSTGEIKIIYGNCTDPGTANTSGTTPQVGIRGNSTTFANNVSPLMIGNVPTGTSCDWSKAVTGNSNASTMLFSGTTNASVKIPNGLQYSWMPGTQLPVRTFAATTAVTTNGATVSWTAPTGATAYNVQYRALGSCDWTNFTGNPVSTTTASLSGLTQNTTYQVQVQALNGGVQAMYSHIPNLAGSGNGYATAGSFTTSANCASTVTGLASSAVTPDAATISWTASTTPPGNGYEYYYSTSATTPLNSVTPSGSTTAGVVTANLSGLTPNTTYNYWVRANCNGVDKGVWSSSASFTTPSLCPTITAPAAGATGLSTTPTITWTAINGATGYKVNVGTTSGGNDIVNNADVTGTSYTFASPLNTSTKYYYTVSGYTANTGATTCTVRDFTTVCSVLSAPYSETFSSGILPICWSTQNPTSTSTDPNVKWKFTGNADYGASLANNGRASGTYAWVDASSPYTGIHNVELLSPSINLTGLAVPYVSFEWFKNHSTSTSTTVSPSSYDNNKLTLDINDGNGWVTIFTGTTNSQLWRSEGIVLASNYIGATVQLRFSVDKDVAGNGYFYDDILLDNVEIKEAPSCLSPNSLAFSNLTSTGADINWMAPTTPPAMGYDVYYSSNNTAPTGSTIPQYTGVTGTMQNVPGTSGSTFYVWVRSNCSVSSQSTWVGPVTYTIPFPPPANDICSGAISLTVGGVFADNALTTSNAGATTDGTTSCQSNRGDNVWFSVVVPASGNVTVETKGVTGSGLLDTVLSAHSGTCGSLTSIACNDDNPAGGVYSIVSLTGQTPGSTLYFSVWRYTGTAGGVSTNGQFQISAYDSSLALATNEVKTKKSLNVYPNPFSEVLNISDATNVKNVLVTDFSGRLMKTIPNPGSELHLGELKQGMYLVTLEMKDGSKQTIKAIKK
ncbi:fibronectin type III domain-containing protein [Chryseobacterium taeanense]|uniref:fibronectin type III domain-containing protein n=1 Tax=Chryseobacterium taeanense TaxID=311334 RepID=UPI0035AED947